MTLVCELHADCEDPAVAQIGIPSKSAIFVCIRGFNDWQEGLLTPAQINAAVARRKGEEDAPSDTL